MNNEKFVELERRVDAIARVIMLILLGSILMSLIVTVTFFLTVGSMI